MKPSDSCSLIRPQVVAIANDITYNSGSFGPREDAVFHAMTEYALEQRLPLVYLAANSGARVGLASEIKACLQVRQFELQLLGHSWGETISDRNHNCRRCCWCTWLPTRAQRVGLASEICLPEREREQGLPEREGPASRLRLIVGT